MSKSCMSQGCSKRWKMFVGGIMNIYVPTVFAFQFILGGGESVAALPIQEINLTQNQVISTTSFGQYWGLSGQIADLTGFSGTSNPAGWTAWINCTTSVSNGALYVDNTAVTPRFMTASTAYSLSMDTYRYLEIEFVRGAAGSGIIYFRKDGNSIATSGQNGSFSFGTSVGDTGKIILDMQQIVAWSGGNLTGLGLEMHVGLASSVIGTRDIIKSVRLATDISPAVWVNSFYTVVPDEMISLGEWNNGDSEGWPGSANDVVDLSVNTADGTLQATVSGVDPSVTGPDISAEGYDARQYRYLEIRYTIESTGQSDGVLYFDTSACPGMSPDRKVVWSLPDDHGTFTVLLDLYSHPMWTGNVRRVRLDPYAGSGAVGADFNIDYVRLGTESSVAFRTAYQQASVSDEGVVFLQYAPDGSAGYLPVPVELSCENQFGFASYSISTNSWMVSGAQYTALNAFIGGSHSQIGSIMFPTGGTMGQSFSFQSGLLHRIDIDLRRDAQATGTVDMVLYAGGPGGSVVAAETVDLCYTQHQTWELPGMLPPGTYFLEVSNPQPAAAREALRWRYVGSDVYSGTAYVNGTPVSADMSLTYYLADHGVADWCVTFDGSDAELSLLNVSNSISGFTPRFEVRMGWDRDGFDLDDPLKNPFDYITTDTGRFWPLEAYKRYAEPNYELVKECGWLYFKGRNGYDLALTDEMSACKFAPRSNQLAFYAVDGAMLNVFEPSDVMYPDFPEFITGDSERDAAINRLLHNNLTHAQTAPYALNAEGLRFAWLDHPLSDKWGEYIQFWGRRQSTNGAIWLTSSGGEGNSFPEGTLNFILASHLHYLWTGDDDQLCGYWTNVQSAAENFVLGELGGSSGVLTALPSIKTYMDIQMQGWKSAWLNVHLVPVLKSMSQLELARGNLAASYEYRNLISAAYTNFNNLFWAGDHCLTRIDQNNLTYDVGESFTACKAVEFGYVTGSQAEAVFDWLETTETASGEADALTKWGMGARSMLVDAMLPQHGQVQMGYGYPYDLYMENGGCCVVFTFDELLARMKAEGADGTWSRFCQILDRADAPDALTGGSPMFEGELRVGNGQIGSIDLIGGGASLIPTSLLYTFMGMDPQPEGLVFRPQLPSGVPFVGVEGMVYRGVKLDVTAYSNRVEAAWAGGSETLWLTNGCAVLSPDLILPCSSTAIGSVNFGVAGTENAVGGGFVMYSAQDVHSRFASNPPHSYGSDHLIAVIYENGQWKYDYNLGFQPFTPASTDVLIAAVDYSLDAIEPLKGFKTEINGMKAGYLNGDLTFAADWWNGALNDGEFTVEGSFFKR